MLAGSHTTIANFNHIKCQIFLLIAIYFCNKLKFFAKDSKHIFPIVLIYMHCRSISYLHIKSILIPHPYYALSRMQYKCTPIRQESTIYFFHQIICNHNVWWHHLKMINFKILRYAIDYIAK